MACMERSEDNLWELVLYFYHVSPRDKTCLGSRHLHPLRIIHCRVWLSVGSWLRCSHLGPARYGNAAHRKTWKADSSCEAFSLLTPLWFRDMQQNRPSSVEAREPALPHTSPAPELPEADADVKT